MDREELEDRIDKVDERVKSLWRQYPVVTAAVAVGGYVVLRVGEAVLRWVF